LEYQILTMLKLDIAKSDFNFPLNLLLPNHL
jgi:hypothetical protein